jgi:hypothetical protein
MKHVASTLLLSALVLVCGCGAGGVRDEGARKVPAAGLPVPTPHGPNIVGNWHFSTTSTIAGTPPLTIDGSIEQSGSSVSGAVHVDGSNCFDLLTTMLLTGTLTDSNVALTSAPVAGQVAIFTLTSSSTDNAFTGTFTINGGCANGEQADLTGIKIPFIASTLGGAFTSFEGKTFDVAGDIAQSGDSADGSFALSGTVTFSTSCFSSGTIMPGMFPSGSFIIGTSVAIEIETGNGTVAFLGTLNPNTGGISGGYKVFGGSCDQTGTAALITSSQIDY